jgi:polyisoprenyl-phosphate glycosyltransferase
MKLSIVVPIYHNELNLPDTIPRLLSLQEKISYDLELIFVDDGSKDRSLEVLLEYQAKYPTKIIVIKLTRNFGAFAAIQAGFMKASGQCVGVIMADLQDPPELFIQMVNNWERGIKAVFAIRTEREDPMPSKFFSNTYYSLFRRFAIPGYPRGGFDFLLVDRQIVNDVNAIKEKNTNIMTLIYWLGYPYITIPYKRKKRQKGKSKWTIGKRIKLAIDSFLGFSYFPIRLLSALGFLFSMGAFAYGIKVFYDWLLGKVPVHGFTALMIMITLTAGIQMIMLGVLGEYLWRIMDQSRNRPIYVIDKVYGADLRQTSATSNISALENQ